MTPESAIERLEAAEKAMTPGDWRAADCIQPKILLYTSKPKGEGPEIAYSYCDMDGKARGNLKGIALLRNAAPALLAVARAAAAVADANDITKEAEFAEALIRLNGALDALAALVTP